MTIDTTEATRPVLPPSVSFSAGWIYQIVHGINTSILVNETLVLLLIPYVCTPLHETHTFEGYIFCCLRLSQATYGRSDRYSSLDVVSPPPEITEEPTCR